MAMNLAHRLLCSSERWAATVESDLLPWVLDGVEMGDNVLEIGPGYGANIRVLIDRVPHYTAVELDTPMAQRLDKLYGEQAHIINGDGTDTGLPAEEFTSVLCFTMLHHIPTADLQDRLFAEAYRVLRRNGVFVGSDSLSSLRFRVLHFRDVCNPVTPQTLTTRLCAAGFVGVQVDTSGDRQRWHAVKAG